MFNIITPCTRIENLRVIYDSIYSQKVDKNLISWYIIFDSKEIPSNIFDIIPGNLYPTLNKISLSSFKGEKSVAGHAQRNFIINKIKDGWIYSVDDDNVILPEFLSEMQKQIQNYPDKKIIVVDQVNKDGSLRLTASPTNTKVGFIDTAQFIFKKETAIPFQSNIYEADGLFIEELYSKHPDDFLFINLPLSVYNYLK